ncbi:hypothetical protein GCM10010916_38420 [Paenibacillus abyssi]|uniref:Uncharacterized protein n=1 Tax=Paenibacillus abyssi TaxID=1340531 RepID=A0A917G1B3_9BACL|nr:hypothetical protein GCM10010916_38420 [Paenibacillus abyssi]
MTNFSLPFVFIVALGNCMQLSKFNYKRLTNLIKDMSVQHVLKV